MSYGRRVNFRPPLLDVLIAAAFVVMTVAEAVLNPTVSSPVEHIVVAGLAMASLAWRRRAPIVVAALVVASNVIVNPEGQFSTLLSLVLVCFTVGFETRPPVSYVGLALVMVPFVIDSIVHTLEPSDLAAALVFFAGPWTVGSVTRDRATRAEEARDDARAVLQEAQRAREDAAKALARLEDS